MRPSSSSPQWLCGNMLAMDDQWQSSRIVSVKTNRVLNKHHARSVNILIKKKLVHNTQSAQQAQSKEHNTYIVKDNSMHVLSSSPQWLCGKMPAMDGRWQSSRIVSIRTNRVLNKHQARSVNILIKTFVCVCVCVCI